MTGWLLSKLVSNRETAVTPARIAMLQRPFVLDGWTHGLAEWLAPFATTRTSSMATARASYATLTMPALVLWGARDSLTPMPQGEDIVRLIRGGRCCRAPGTSRRSRTSAASTRRCSTSCARRRRAFADYRFTVAA
ncbi:MAG: alpha/beta fold hydrolase [Gemmatimonadaceae bacterium]